MLDVEQAGQDFAIRELANRYFVAAVAADRMAIAAVVDEGLNRGLTLAQVLLEVVVAAQRRIGDAWHRGEVSIAQEHWASEVAALEVSRLGRLYPARRKLDRSAVVATPAGERHALPARVVATLLTARGWQVDDLSPDLPAVDLAAFVAGRHPDLVALSVTVEEKLAAAAESARLLQNLEPAPKVLVGGAAFGNPARLPDDFPADAVAPDASSGVEIAEVLVGTAGLPDPATYLATVGGRVARLRHRCAMSQAQLAAAAGITRSYLSAVEQGGQNITLEAALRLAAGLEVGIGELLSESDD